MSVQSSPAQLYSLFGLPATHANNMPSGLDLKQDPEHKWLSTEARLGLSVRPALSVLQLAMLSGR